MADTPLSPDSVRANPEPASGDSIRHSRRALLTAMAVAPLAAATATLAVPLVHNGAITEAYRRWQKHYRAIQASPTGPTDYDDWDIVCDAEKVILGSADSSSRAAEMRLWVLLSNMSCDVNYVLGEDIQSLVGDDGLDWDVKFAVRALADVRRLAGGR